MREYRTAHNKLHHMVANRDFHVILCSIYSRLDVLLMFPCLKTSSQQHVPSSQRFVNNLICCVEHLFISIWSYQLNYTIIQLKVLLSLCYFSLEARLKLITLFRLSQVNIPLINLAFLHSYFNLLLQYKSCCENYLLGYTELLDRFIFKWKSTLVHLQ